MLPTLAYYRVLWFRWALSVQPYCVLVRIRPHANPYGRWERLGATGSAVPTLGPRGERVPKASGRWLAGSALPLSLCLPPSLAADLNSRICLREERGRQTLAKEPCNSTPWKGMPRVPPIADDYTRSTKRRHSALSDATRVDFVIMTGPRDKTQIGYNRDSRIMPYWISSVLEKDTETNSLASLPTVPILNPLIANTSIPANFFRTRNLA